MAILEHTSMPSAGPQLLYEPITYIGYKKMTFLDSAIKLENEFCIIHALHLFYPICKKSIVGFSIVNSGGFYICK